MANSCFVLEGDPILRRWLVRTLRARGYDCLGATARALDALLHFPRAAPGPDLLLVGHCPDCDYGLNATLGLFHLLHPTTKIIVLASSPAMLRPGVATLRKPFSDGQLGRMLKTLENPPPPVTTLPVP